MTVNLGAYLHITFFLREQLRLRRAKKGLILDGNRSIFCCRYPTALVLTVLKSCSKRFAFVPEYRWFPNSTNLLYRCWSLHRCPSGNGKKGIRKYPVMQGFPFLRSRPFSNVTEFVPKTESNVYGTISGKSTWSNWSIWKLRSSRSWVAWILKLSSTRVNGHWNYFSSKNSIKALREHPFAGNSSYRLPSWCCERMGRV